MKPKPVNIKQNFSIKSENKDHSFELIENRVDNYITKKKVWDKARKVIFQLFTLVFAIAISLTYSDEIKILIKKIIISDADFILIDDVENLKTSLLSEIPIGYFEGIVNENTFPDPSIVYARLINRFNNDFYGKAYNLSSSDEQQLFTFITHAGLNIADLTNLDRPLLGDTTKSIKEWLLDKTNNSDIPATYYNPKFYDLVNEINMFKSQLKTELITPMANSVRDTVKNYLIKHDLGNVGRDQLRAEIVLFFKNHQQYLKKEIELTKLTWEREQELNLRLGLFNIYLGKEYNADTPEKIFSWLQSNIKSSGFFNKRGELTELAEQDTAFINSLNTYNVALQQNIRIYKKLEMGKQKVELCNPLRIPLAANRFGLFGSRRKSSYGRLYKHQGIDIIADEGTAVYAVKDGFVVYVGNKKNGHGNQIKILHDNKVVSLYAHLKSDKVWQRTLDRYRAEGAFWMDSLTPIASVGSSGNIPKYDEQYGYAHLHLEIEIDGKSKNPFQMLNDPIQVY